MVIDYENKVVRARSCSACGREFAPLERYLSALFEEGEEFRRRDYCERCWQGPPEGSFSYWRGRVPPEEEPEQRFVEEGELLELFGRLEGVRESRQQAFRYLLGLLLMRKRLLKQQSGPAREPGSSGAARLMVLEEADGGAAYEVSIPRLTQGELDEVSAQMGTVLRIAPPPAGEMTQEEREDV